MSTDLIIRWILSLTVVLVSTSANYADCSEEYYINNDKVLLYKIINWWYDTPPEETYPFCESPVRCRAKDIIQIEYNAAKKKLKLNTKENFAELLSIFKQCKECRGPSYFELTWINKKYFGDAEYTVPTDRRSTLNTYIFKHIEKNNALRIQGISDDIELELEGVICGLMNGKIALHHSGELLKTCRIVSEKKESFFPITLKIVNSLTKEILVELSMVFDGEK